MISYQEQSSATGLKVKVQGRPNAGARLIVFKPARDGVENRRVTLDAQGRASVTFDASTITQPIQKSADTVKKNTP